ncbi:unnamed protein product [Caenorhabditis brenneri]
MSFYYQDIGKDWSIFQNWTQYVSAAISLPLNSFLIYLIIAKSPEKLGAYKYLMISISVYEIAYSIVDVIISPICHSFGSAFLVIVITKHRILSPSALLALDATYCGFFGFSMAIFVIHFVYRYLVASGSNLLLTFNSYKIGLWLSIPLIVGIVWALVTLFLNGPTDEISEHVRYNVLKSLDLHLDEFVYVGPCFYWITESGEYVGNIKPIIGMIVLSFILTSSITLVVFFSVKCYLRIKKMIGTKSRASRTTQNLQTQLFHALVIQTLIPAILMYLPVSVMFLFTFLNIDLGSTSGTATITIALYPAIDPLPNIIIIRHYRQAVCGEH